MVVLIIFFFMVVLGLIFYVRYSLDMGEKSLEESLNLQAIEIASRLEYLPEIQCTYGAVIKYSCVDRWKMEKFKESKYLDIYDSVLPGTYVVLNQVYPAPELPTVDNPHPGIWPIYGQEPESYKLFRIPVTIYDAVEKTNNMGYFEIWVSR